MPGSRFLHLLLSWPLLFGASLAGATIFGDGDPANGIEDNRQTLSQGSRDSAAHGWFEQAGTIVCDGAVRGSAVVLDTRGHGPTAGIIIATAAHVLFDLETGQPWAQCQYHHLGLGQLPGYQAGLNWAWLQTGAFDPLADPSSPSQGQGDWAFAWLGPDWSLPRGGPGLKPVARDPLTLQHHGLGLVAWDSTRSELSVTTGCQAVHSDTADLGGGVWAGQWLDDCDSGFGASGGGLVALDPEGPQLVGLRGGSHWLAGHEGQLDGGRWDVMRSTNYARAFDPALLRQLEQFLASLPELDTPASVRAEALTSP